MAALSASSKETSHLW